MPCIHSAPRLYWLNAARFHPIDIALLYIVGYVPLVGLGCPEAGNHALRVIRCRLRDAAAQQYRCAPRTAHWIFSMAEPHRWHHSRTLEEANTNYGSNLMIWDVAFGTFFLPGEREPPQNIGIANMPDFR
jgi:sterol desaturase/sphingolipid hydroxylase (fatty acid hydroxylase superfamily)